jgi:hypothetical protein
MKRGNWLIKLGGFLVLAALIYRPAGVEEKAPFMRHFEVSMPKMEAPKLVSVTLPEERAPRSFRPSALLLPIEPDPSSEIKIDLAE